MIKLKKVAAFDPNSNRMKVIADVEEAIKEFQKKKNKNLDFLLKNRFSWMKKFISAKDKGLEVGAGAGFSKNYIKNKNFKISDLAMHDHLDLKNIDAQNTRLDSESYDFVIAVNMLHHVPYPIKFLNEMFKILKPGGKLIIQEAHCSIVFQLITIIMRHEGFDFTKNVWDEKTAMSNEDDIWSGNITISHLIFDDIEKFNSKFGKKFNIIHQKFFECFVFLNSGGVTSKTFYIPLNNFFLKILNFIDNILIKLFPNVFALGRQIVLKKI
jgi:SAM-dependent methyltransferase